MSQKATPLASPGHGHRRSTHKRRKSTKESKEETKQTSGPSGTAANSSTADTPVEKSPGAPADGVIQLELPVYPGACPRGLEYLCLLDQVLVHQKIELLEVSECCARNCFKMTRCFDMFMLDFAHNLLMYLVRPMRYSQSCCCCCLQTMEVQIPAGVVAGYLHQIWTPWSPCIAVCNAQGKATLWVDGPCITTDCCFQDVVYRVKTKDDTQIGLIIRQYPGVLRDVFTDADNFSVTFPVDLEVTHKAMLIACTILLDYMYYEDRDRKRRDDTSGGVGAVQGVDALNSIVN
ncbi:phospholipid scramblase 1-like isoform X2 [Ornithodoros turicata]|uniref:phospholipid scramblase 1-like isoform X2 n=1 Tax=Ornithodoros turicata TaxID=34597 RepID=UPI003139AED3